MNGAGKYDDACTQARTSTQALGAALIVIGGKEGHGFSVQMPMEALIKLPDMLEFMAKQIRLDIESGQTSH